MVYFEELPPLLVSTFLDWSIESEKSEKRGKSFHLEEQWSKCRKRADGNELGWVWLHVSHDSLRYNPEVNSVQEKCFHGWHTTSETFFFFFYVYNKSGFHIPFCPRGRRAEKFSSRIETGIITGLYARRKKCLGHIQSKPSFNFPTCETLLSFWSNSNRRDFLSYTHSGLTRDGK